MVIVMFRRQIAEQIGKIRGFSAAGVSADLAGVQESSKTAEISASITPTEISSTTAAAAPTTAAEAGMWMLPGLVATSHAGAETVKMLNPDFHKDTPIERLARYWAASWGLEHTYWVIFGTQLQIVQKANTGSVTTAFVQEQYNKSAALGNNQSFEQYLGFLTSSQLLKQGTGDTFVITITGRQLLMYITLQGYTLLKGL
ncbi:MAG TPA: hypothetical protein VHR97_07150 [Candidatus Baltobacteraceae bacterium]|nr:hypothetical protein [Candidatus Baltobacteraceae bacterium]